MFQLRYIIIALLCAASAKAATYTAASCSQADIQTAITAELATPADGDIISIPSGTCTWTGSTQLTVTFTTSVSIMGAGAKSATTGGSSIVGSDLTTIIDNLSHGPSSTIAITTTAGKSFRWTGIALLENVSSTVAGNGVLNIAGPSTSVRIDHSHFFAQLSGAVMVYLGGSVQGVADHDFFDALSSLGITNDIAFHNGLTWNGDASGFGDKSWTDSDHFGSSQFFFAEDDQFNNGDPTDAHDGARYVVRYSTINGGGGNGQFFNHGLTNARGRATRAAEVYNNTMFQSAANGAVSYSINSGSLLFWGNTVTQWRYAVGIDYTRKDNNTYNYATTPTNWGNCGASSPSGGSNWDQNSLSNGYACMDAPARGSGDLLTGNFPSVLNSVTSSISWPRQVIDPIYIWNNTYTPATGFSPEGITSSIGLFTANTDYYQQFGTFGQSGSNCTTSPCNITVGVNQTSRSPVNGTDTCTAGPGGNTPGVGWWNTANNTLYVCNPTNTWAVYYTPYTYPNPLTTIVSTPTSLNGGSGASQDCNGFAPAPCARTDVAATLDNNGNPSNGPSTPFFTGSTNTPFIDPYFGERVVRVTNGSTASNASGDSWSTPNSGWVRNFNCAGTSLGTCQSGTPMFVANDGTAGAGIVVFQINRNTLNLSRVDQVTLGGPKILNAVESNWSSVNPNLLYTVLGKTETCSSSAICTPATSAPISFSSYLFNPASPGTPAPTLILNLNTGPNGNSWDNQTGSGGLISALNGLVSVKGWPKAIAPIVCDGTTCTEGTSTLTNGTCGTVTGGTAGAGCITVSTSGGSLNNTFSFALTQDDAGTPPSEQNISGYTNNSSSSPPFTNYAFAGSGSVTAVTAPTKVTSPLTAVNWDFYVAGPAHQFFTGTSRSLAVRQFQISYATATSCPGAGCPTFPFTNLSHAGGSGIFIDTVSAANPINRSCEKGVLGGNCSVQTMVVNADDSQFVFDTGGVGANGVNTIAFVWHPVKGARWLDLTTGVVSNGATDANGNACPAATCWSTAGSGPITFHPDPNDTSLSQQVYQGMTLHEIAATLDGATGHEWIFLSLGIGANANDGPMWWDPNSGDVWNCSTAGSAGNCTGHNVFGYAGDFTYTQTGGAAIVVDGNFGWVGRSIVTNTEPLCSLFPTTPCIQQNYAFQAAGPCSAAGPCVFPAPNFHTTSYAFTGSGRADSHGSKIDETPTNTEPWPLYPYVQLISENLATAANSQTRTGCPSACVDTFKISGGAVAYLPGDRVTITGLADNSFNITCYVATIVTYGGTQFTCNDPGKTNVNTQAQTGGGTAYKIDASPGRGWENEVIDIQEARATGQSGSIYRIAHQHFDTPVGPLNTGPNGSVSPDGHYALWTTFDGSGGNVTTCALGGVAGSGGSNYVNGDTGTINNPVTGATLATYTVTGVSSGAVTTLTCTGGTLYIAMNNMQTTTGGAQPGSGTGLLINVTGVGAGRIDVGLAEIK